MLPALFRYSSLAIPKAVFMELTIPGYDGSDFFMELCSTGAVKVYEPAAGSPNKIPESLHAGEREVIELFHEAKGDFIIIDDGRGSAFCRDNNIPYVNALLIVKILFFKQLITEPEYLKSWTWLLEKGRYSDSIKIWAENADAEMLKTFI